MKYGIALGALQREFFVDATLEAEAPRLRVGVAARAPDVHPKMSRSPHPGEDAPAGAARHADLRRVRVPRRTSPARTERVRLGTHVYNIGLRHPFTTARGRADARHRSRAGASSSASARPGSRRSGSRRSSTSRPAAAGSTKAIEVCKRLWTEDEVSHHGEFFDVRRRRCSSRSRCSGRGRRSSSAASRRPRCAARRASATAGSAWRTRFESGAAQIGKLRTLLAASTGRDRPASSRSCSVARSSRATT